MTTNLSVQLYTVRHALEAEPDATLAALAGFGYTLVEPFALPRFADTLRCLPDLGLSAPTAHAALVDADLDEVFTAARRLGVQTVIEPYVHPDRWTTVEDIAATARQLNAAAERAADVGLRVGYHNHHFEIVNVVDGAYALEVLARHLAPGVVLEVDTYWAHAGGADVPALLRRLGDRVVAVHVKDGDGSTDARRQVPVGSGTLPIAEILDAAPDALWVVELDDSEGDLLDAVRASREFLVDGLSRPGR